MNKDNVRHDCMYSSYLPKLLIMHPHTQKEAAATKVYLIFPSEVVATQKS